MLRHLVADAQRSISGGTIIAPASDMQGGSYRARIVEAAAHVFAQKARRGAVIDDFILRPAYRAHFYNYFRTISELLEATSPGWRMISRVRRDTGASIETWCCAWRRR